MKYTPRGASRRTLAQWIARAFTGTAAVAILSAGSCDKSQGPEPVPAPDFARRDVNATSATFDTDVSPRDHLGAVSAWYFGHAT